MWLRILVKTFQFCEFLPYMASCRCQNWLRLAQHLCYVILLFFSLLLAKSNYHHLRYIIKNASRSRNIMWLRVNIYRRGEICAHTAEERILQGERLEEADWKSTMFICNVEKKETSDSDECASEEIVFQYKFTRIGLYSVKGQLETITCMRLSYYI